VWYYPGETIGNEFVYPKSQAMKIAKESHTRVLAMNNDNKTTNTVGEIPTEMKSANLGYFDENGNWQSDNGQQVAIANPPPTTVARAETTPAPTMKAAGTSGSRKHLPRTASSLALFELISGLSLAGGFAVRQLRQRLS
jgi:hypothetical protein